MATYSATRESYHCSTAAATMLLLFGLLLAMLDVTGAQIGVCYGMNGNDLPPPQEVVDLYKSQNIQRMRLYAPNPEALQALSGSNIELMLGIPNEELQGISTDDAIANDWVQRNIVAYPGVNFKYIVAGNEISPVNDKAQLANFVLPAMQRILMAIQASGLQIKVSTSVEAGILGNTYPPSLGQFRDDVMSYIGPIITFLDQSGAPLLANIYPYFAYQDNTADISLSYALFTSQANVTPDPNSGLAYQNLFDAMVDAFHFALDKANGVSVGLVVSETGWPTAAGTSTSVDTALTYNTNLISHVSNGTPKKPGPLETYVFAMFDENEKTPELEMHWGLFTPDKQAKYPITFL